MTRMWWRLVRDRTGGVAVLIALAMPVVVGGFGLGTEAGIWYLTQRKLQHAADVAAFAAASELRAGRVDGISEAARAAARESGLDPTRGVVEVTPAVAARRVEVVLREDQPRRFTRLFGSGDVPLSARSVAEISGADFQSCILALHPSERGAITFIGNHSSIMAGCNVHANSLHEDSIIVGSESTSVEVDCISSAGGISKASRDRMTALRRCAAALEYAGVVEDPFLDLPEPSTAGMSCPSSTTLGGAAGSSYTIGPGCYGDLKIQRTVTLEPGLYIVDGLEIGSQAEVTGEGVTFYIRNSGKISMNGGTVQLSAPEDGDFRNILIYASRKGSAGVDHKVNGNLESVIEGVIYAPQGDVTFNGTYGNQGGACARFVTRTMHFSGNSSIGIDCTPIPSLDLRSVQHIRLVE